MVRNSRNEIQKNYIASQSFAFKKYQWKTTRKSLIMELCTKSIVKKQEKLKIIWEKEQRALNTWEGNLHRRVVRDVISFRLAQTDAASAATGGEAEASEDLLSR